MGCCRLWGRRPGWAVAGGRGCRQLGEPSAGGRGASLPANPCSFVAGHHVFGAERADRRAGVVLQSPLTLVPSSPGTTSLGSHGPTAGWTWCFTPRKPLFLRRRAPRLWGRMGRPPGRRGAPLPAIPCSFVAGHHVFGAEWADRRAGVVLPCITYHRFPQAFHSNLPNGREEK